MKRSFWLFGAIFSLLFVSCENDIEKNKTYVFGYWSVKKAFRDKRETNLLSEVFFRFEANGKMLTNLPNTSDQPTDFEVQEATIIQKIPSPIQYNIEQISDSSMVLTMTMRNTPFEIHLIKTTPPLPSELTPPMPSDSL